MTKGVVTKVDKDFVNFLDDRIPDIKKMRRVNFPEEKSSELSRREITRMLTSAPSMELVMEELTQFPRKNTKRRFNSIKFNDK